MRFKHQISITSETGVGSSTLLKALQAKLADQPYRWVSGGALFRDRARQLHMTIEQFVAYCCAHPEEGHDKWCDSVIAEMAKTDWLVCESRLAHFFMPGAFKVLLVCKLETRARRRHRDRPGSTFESVLADIRERDRHDTIRYTELYPGCLWNQDRFNLVVDTELLSPNAIAEFVLEERVAWAMDRTTLVEASLR